MRIRTAAVAAAAAGLLAAPAAALAQTTPSYPEPSNPGAVSSPPKGKTKTYTVCKKKSCDFRKIQKAVNKAKKGDRIKVKPGIYKEAVSISGAKKSFIKLIGSPKAPDRVVLQGSGKRTNGVFVNGADQVTVRGFHAKNYTSNGFFFVNVVGYMARDLVAEHTGVYGIYAFNSKGGTMRDSTAFYNNDAGFYIGQTPPQAKPVRSIVKNIESYGNPLGWSGTNMRYVTITKSRFYNNAAGIVPNAMDGEKFPPAEDNIITDNDIFWNNFNFHLGAPFKIREDGAPALVPVGTGVILIGGRRNVVSNNRVYGNWMMGVGAVQSVLIADPENLDAVDLVGNQVMGNDFGLGGTDLNGRDLAYYGNGTGNCFGPNTGVSLTIPADGSTLEPCPFTGANTPNAAAVAEMLPMVGKDGVGAQIKHPHAAKEGFVPLETYTP